MFCEMTPREVEIRLIHNIRLIQIYELSGTIAKLNERDDVANESRFVREDREYACMAMAVTYGESRQINLSELDEGFEYLVNHIIRMYRNSEYREKILMDRVTREFLEAAIVPEDRSAWNRYYKLKPGTAVASMDSALAKRFLPVVEYLIVGLNKVLGEKQDLEITSATCGWRGAGRIQASIGKQKASFLVRTERITDTGFRIFVTEFPKKDSVMTIRVDTAYDCLRLRYESDDPDMRGESKFFFYRTGFREEHAVYRNGVPVYFNAEDHDENDPLVDAGGTGFRNRVWFCMLPDNRKVVNIYKLPCNILYVLQEEITNGKQLQSIDALGTYAYDGADYLQAFGRTNLYNIKSKMRLHTDSSLAELCCLRNGLVQTYFAAREGNQSGRYSERLANRFFTEQYVIDMNGHVVGKPDIQEPAETEDTATSADKPAEQKPEANAATGADKPAANNTDK